MHIYTTYQRNKIQKEKDRLEIWTKIYELKYDPTLKSEGLSGLVERVSNLGGKDVTPEELKGKCREEELVSYRQGIYFMGGKPLLNISTTIIGLFLGGRDHTTVLGGAKKVREALIKAKVYIE